MSIVLTKSFRKRLRKKPPEAAGAVLRTISLLDENPRHPGLHTHRVQGTPGTWEAYVDQANRVTFRYEDGDMVMLNHCNHTIIGR